MVCVCLARLVSCQTYWCFHPSRWRRLLHPRALRALCSTDSGGTCKVASLRFEQWQICQELFLELEGLLDWFETVSFLTWRLGLGELESDVVQVGAAHWAAPDRLVWVTWLHVGHSKAKASNTPPSLCMLHALRFHGRLLPCDLLCANCMSWWLVRMALDWSESHGLMFGTPRLKPQTHLLPCVCCMHYSFMVVFCHVIFYVLVVWVDGLCAWLLLCQAPSFPAFRLMSISCLLCPSSWRHLACEESREWS